ncbi:MAG: hypothetical protein QXZ36_03740 [Thermoproteota archaeon]
MEKQFRILKDELKERKEVALEIKRRNPRLSLRRIGGIVGVGHTTVWRWLLEEGKRVDR